VMNYFFSDVSGLKPFHDLGRELGKVGRIPELLPPVERGVYAFDGIAAAPRVKVGADVLPWWPAAGVYLPIERGGGPMSAGPLDDSLDQHADELAPAYRGMPTIEDHLAQLAKVRRLTFDAGWARHGWPERVGGFGGTSLVRAYLSEALTVRDLVQPGFYSMPE